MPRYIAFACGVLGFALASAAVECENQPRFTGGAGGYDTYRIPALAVTAKGAMTALPYPDQLNTFLSSRSLAQAMTVK